MSRRLAPALAAGVVAAALPLLAPAAAHAAAGFTAGNVVVYRVGTGGSTLLTSAGTAVSLDEFTAAGAAGTSVGLPTATSGANKPLVASGTAGSEGLLTLSADSRYLVATGYAAAVGTAGVSGSAAASVPRTIGRVAADKTVDTSTALTDYADKNNPRGATSADGSQFWVSGAAGGVRYATRGASTSTALVSDTYKNVRQVEVAGGQLYTSADPTKAGVTIATVGSNLPTSGTQPVTNLPFSTPPTDPYAYSFLTLGTGAADTLYVADSASNSVLKYTLQSGVWTAHGSVTVSGVTGLTANDDNGTVTIFATNTITNADKSTVANLFKITDASGLGGTMTGSATVISTASNEAFRGVAFTPGTVIGTGSGTPPPAPPTATPDHTALPAALGDPTNPTLGVTVADDTVSAAQLTLTASSSNQSVAADSGIAVTGSGAARTLSVTPGAVGNATITLTVTAPDGTTSSTQVRYGVSAAIDNARYYTGAGNASVAIDVGGGYFLVGDDENNTIRLYQHDVSGPPVRSFPLSSLLPFGATEVDLEAGARSGDVVYWTGSMSNSSSGSVAPSRSTIFATAINGSGANTTLTYLSAYTGLKDDLIAWDHSNGHGLGADYLGLAASAAAGVGGHQNDALNVEGAEFASDGTSYYLSFRAPLEPTTHRHLAMLVPVTNVPALTAVGHSPSLHASFGAPVFLDLGGLGIRDIRKNAAGDYLIVAGTADDTNTSFVLYTWDGNPAHAPRRSTVLPMVPTTTTSTGSWETIVSVPSTLTTGATIPLVQDDGNVAWYADGLDSKGGLAPDLQKSLGLELTLADRAAQSTSTTLTADSTTSQVGDAVTYTATVTPAADASGTPSGTVTFADASGAIAGCTSQPLGSGTAQCTITYDTAGTRDVTASYSGDTDFAASTSDPVEHGVVLLTPTVTLSVSSDPHVAGRPLALDAGVGPTSAYSPGGTVTFTSDGATLAGCDSVPVSSGTAHCDATTPAAGAHQVQAVFSGDNHFAAGSSAPTALAVDPEQVLSWSAPGAVTYGTALTADDLDAQSNVAGSFTYAVSAGPDGTVGDAVTAGSVLGAGGYTLTATFTPTSSEYSSDEVAVPFTVRRAPLTISASAASTTYGAPAPTITATYSGFVNGDDSSTLDVLPTCTTTVTPTTGAGTYDDAATCSGASDDDYAIAYQDAPVTVAKAPLQVIGVPSTRVYGAPDPAFAVTYAGFVNGDTAGDLTGSLQFTATMTIEVNGVPQQIVSSPSSPHGRYWAVPSGLGSPDYALSYFGAALQVTKAKLTVTPADATRTYGAADPDFSLQYSGFVAGDDSSVVSGTPAFTAVHTRTANGVTTRTPSSPTSAPGAYVISVSGLSADDYVLTYGHGTLTVTKAPLTITADSFTRAKGRPNPMLTAHYSGFVNGEGPGVLSGALVLKTAADETSKPRVYPIVVKGVYSPDYAITFVNGTLTVTAR